MKSELPENEFDVKILDPARISVFRSDAEDSFLRMTIDSDTCWVDVRIALAQPFTDPNHYVGFRDSKDKEIGMLETLEGVDPDSLRLIHEALDRRYFTPKISKVNRVVEEFGLTVWEVSTNRGDRRFVVRNIRDSTQLIGPNRLMITDTEGNRYEFPSVSSVSQKAMEILNKVT